MDRIGTSEITKMAAEIVTAYVSHNAIAPAEVANMISDIYDALAKKEKAAVEAAPKATPTPAVPISESVTPDYLICLEDGLPFKALRRHLRSAFNMSPEDYRAKWNLPKDYPMVAPNYTATRSALAKGMGLGQAGKVMAAPVPRRPAETGGRRANRTVAEAGTTLAVPGKSASTRRAGPKGQN